MIGASDGPIIAGTLITPSDSTIFSQATRGLYIGGGGNLNVEFAIPQPSDTMNNYSNTNVYSNVVFTAVSAGTILPVRVRRVYAASTCTAIVALYYVRIGIKYLDRC